MGQALTSTCPACGQAPDTVFQLLIECPSYVFHRAVHLCTLGRPGRTLAKPFASDEALRPPFKYVDATCRLRQVFGGLPNIPKAEE